MTTITYIKDDIFKRVKLETAHLSSPIGEAGQVAASRMPDMVPMTDSDKEWFDKALYNASVRVQLKLAYYMSGLDTPFEYNDTDIIYKITLYDGADINQIKPMLEQSITNTLIYFVVKEWLFLKGYTAPITYYDEKYNESLNEIKSVLQYGQKTKLKYVQL